MKLSNFDFKLPPELLAEYPAENRDEARLMVVHRDSGEIEHRLFKDLIEYFDDGDSMIINNTKVFPARMYGNKEKTGATIEVFLLRELNAEQRLWDVIVDPARKIRIGNKLFFGDDDSLVAEVIDNTTSRGRTLRFLSTVRTTNSAPNCCRSARLPCRSISNARWSPWTRSITRRFTPKTKELWPHRRPVCIFPNN